MAKDNSDRIWRIRTYVLRPGDRVEDFNFMVASDSHHNWNSVANAVREAFANLSENHIAFVCDAVPDSEFAMGPARPSGQVGESESGNRESLDSPAERLECDTGEPEGDSEPGVLTHP